MTLCFILVQINNGADYFSVLCSILCSFVNDEKDFLIENSLGSNLYIEVTIWLNSMNSKPFLTLKLNAHNFRDFKFACLFYVKKGVHIKGTQNYCIN